MNQSVAFAPTRDDLLRAIGDDLDSVAVLRRRQAMIDAEIAGLLASAARSAEQLGGSLEHSRRSLIAEAATTLHLPEMTVAQRIDEAETLCDNLPATLDALATGDISYRHAQILVRQARTLPEAARAEFEQIVLTKAVAQTPSQLQVHARTIRELMHPDSIDTRHRQARDERGVWVEKEHDGMATLVCHLPAVSAFAIDDTLDQLGRALRSSDETRTHAQLRADALVDLLLDRDGDTTARARGITANIAITVPVLTLLGHSTEAANLQGYGPIDSDTTRRLTAAAPSLQRILTDPITGQRLTVGRDRYKVPADLRAAVILDDETCRFPGCTRRSDRCDLDHTTDWANGGHTSLDNLTALCRRHHTLKHQTDWQVTPAPGRTLHWTSPSGSRHTTVPPGHASPPKLESSPTQSPNPAPPPVPPRAGHLTVTGAHARRSTARGLPDTPPF
jgi:hypothetical protein